MRYWRYPLIVGLIFLSLVALTRADETAAGAVEALGEAMAATGASPARLQINAWAQLPQPGLTDGEMGAIAERAMAKLALTAARPEVRHSRSERQRMVRAEVVGAAMQATVTLQVIHPAWGGTEKAEAYLVVNVETPASSGSIADWRGRVKEAAACGGGSPRISTCLVGWLDGKLDKEVWPERLHNAGEVLDVIAMDTQILPGFVSITGFSPALPDSLTVGDKRINVNMAMRYSPNDNRTYVIVASPVIPGEY